MDIHSLLKKCSQRDIPAWDEFFRRYRGLVSKSVRHKLNKMNIRGDRRLVKDIVQDIFLDLWEKNKLSGIRDARCLDAWLAIISMNTVSARYRKRSVRDALGTLSLDDSVSARSPGFKWKDLIPSPGRDIASVLDGKEMEYRISEAIGRMSAKQRLAVKLSLYDGMKHREISRLLRVPLNTVSTLVSRGKHRIREKIHEYMYNENKM